MAEEVSHKDLYYRIGVLEGKVDSLLQMGTRVTNVEQKLWTWGGAAFMVGLILPFLIGALKPKLRFEHKEPTASTMSVRIALLQPADQSPFQVPSGLNCAMTSSLDKACLALPSVASK